jgi:hypothetical protein
VRLTCAPPLPATPLTGGRPVSFSRRFFVALAAAYLAAVTAALPAAKTREAFETAARAVPVSADADWLEHGHPPHGNPDSDFSDAIPVKGLIVFAAPIPALDVPPATPGVLVGEADAPRPRLIRTRDDFERGPPSLS